MSFWSDLLQIKAVKASTSTRTRLNTVETSTSRLSKHPRYRYR